MPPPNLDPRPPRDRRVAENDSEDQTASGRKRRRSRVGSVSPVAGGGGFMGRLTGRAELDRAKLKRYEPYSYVSNSRQLKWVVLMLLVFATLALALAWQDRATATVLSDLRDQGLTNVPPTSRTAIAIIEYAGLEGIPCVSENEFFTGTAGCNRALAIQSQYADTKDLSSTFFVLLMMTLIGTIFSFGSFTHRASRNLLTLKSKGQGYTPEKSVFWFFIPVLNLIKPWAVFLELFKGSDPTVSTSDESAWKTKGKVPVIVHIWAAIFVAVFFFNPTTVGRIWNSVRESYGDVISAHQQLVIADLLLAVLAISAIFVAVELNRRQEARHAKVGNITVTQPFPVDSLEEALKDGIRRKELEKRRSDPTRRRDER